MAEGLLARAHVNTVVVALAAKLRASSVRCCAAGSVRDSGCRSVVAVEMPAHAYLA